MQFTKHGKAALIGAALIALSPVPAMAAETETTRTTTTQNQGQREDNDFPWGLLGLLGLAGLLGLRKKERDIHVDARRHDETTRRP
ncbi:MAG TPA: WGxxGxxG family protein [Allosphingosinicella sp.]|nr:WGxxGxxG family protein [Allosphingosinicella sp.]